MDRRGFLRALGAIATAAVVAPAVAKVTAPVINKYEESIRLYDIALAAKGNFKECNARFDDLLRYLHANFTTEYNATTAAATREVLRSADITGWRKIPPTVIDEVYPVALARMALKFDEMPLQPSILSEFDKFHRRYGQLIIDLHRIG